MNKAAGTPLSETSATERPMRPFLKPQDVVKVPSYFPGGQHVGVYLVIVADGELGPAGRTVGSFGQRRVRSGERRAYRARPRASRHSIIWRRVRSMVILRSSKSMGFVTKSNAPRFIAVRMFFHVAVGGDHDGTDFGVNVGDLLQEGEAIHAWHVDVRKDHIDIFVLVEACQGFIAIVSEKRIRIGRGGCRGAYAGA